MLVVGVVRSNRIELMQSLNMPDGTLVEVEIRPIEVGKNPFVGLFAQDADVLEDIREEIEERRRTAGWRDVDAARAD